MEYGDKKALEGKPPLQKISPWFTESMARVMAIGDEKHKDCHWTSGIKYSLVLGALKRHTSAVEKGEMIDSETGESHLSHIAVNVMMLFEMERRDMRYMNDTIDLFGMTPRGAP